MGVGYPPQPYKQQEVPEIEKRPGIGLFADNENRHNNRQNNTQKNTYDRWNNLGQIVPKLPEQNFRAGAEQKTDPTVGNASVDRRYGNLDGLAVICRIQRYKNPVTARG